MGFYYFDYLSFMLEILSWNIRQGGGSRGLQICHAISKQKPQILIFSEFQNAEKGNSLRTKLLSLGYRHQFVTSADSNQNSVLICSKIAGNCIHHSIGDPVFGNNILEVRFPLFSLIGVYLPHKKKHSLFSYIRQILVSATIPYIIAGDFNSGKNYIDQNGNSFWYEEELVLWEELGYVDAFRFLNGAKKEYSWYSHQGNGFRYDHTYLHNDLTSILKDCYYLHEWREKKWSDHSPMVLKFGAK
jgi:exonuclease III